MVQPSLIQIGKVDGSDIITPSNPNQVQLFFVQSDATTLTLYGKTSSGAVKKVSNAATDNIIDLS